jgi:hypothetical protein
MRKRSKYRPRPIRTDALDYVLTSLKPVRHLQAEIAALRIRNHGALAEVCKGHATQHDITTLIAALNMTEAIALQGTGEHLMPEIRQAQDALYNLASRGLALGNRFILRGPELQALNQAMDIHDAQLDAISVQQLERALQYVNRELAAGKARPIVAEDEVINEKAEQ